MKPRIHYWFLKKGLPGDLDGFAFHPCSGASAGLEMAAVGQDTSWARPFTMTDADRSFRLQNEQGRDVPVTFAKDGRQQLRLRQAPRYVTGLPDELTLQPEPSGAPTEPVCLFP